MKNFSHDRTPDGKEEWLTDPKILSALGQFDLDPCVPINRPWDTAKHYYTIEDDGLRQKWFGRVWLNPPYGEKTGRFLKVLAEHGDGIALVYARTETNFFFPWVWDYADSIFFFKGRLLFYNVDGTPCTNKKTGKIEKAGAPSCLIAYGEENSKVLQSLPFHGKFVQLKGDKC